MTNDDVQQLADLARLDITDEQAESYRKDFEGILGYLDTLNEVSIEGGDIQYRVVKNALRDDVKPYEPGVFTEDIINQAPKTEGTAMRVNKIL